MDSHAIMIPVVIREARYTSAWSFNHIDGHHHSLSPWQQLDYAELGPVRQFWHRSQRSIPLLTLPRCDQQSAEASTQMGSAMAMLIVLRNTLKVELIRQSTYVRSV